MVLFNRFPFLIHCHCIILLYSLKLILPCEAHVNAVSSVSTALYISIWQPTSVKNMRQKKLMYNVRITLGVRTWLWNMQLYQTTRMDASMLSFNKRIWNAREKNYQIDFQYCIIIWKIDRRLYSESREISRKPVLNTSI